MGVQIVKLLNPSVVVANGLNPKGEYSAGTDYVVGDMVSYNGSSYVMHVDAAAGTAPTDTTKWTQLASKGDTGADSTVPGPPGEDGADGVVQSIVAGDNVTVDNTDPANPVVSSTGGGGGGGSEWTTLYEVDTGSATTTAIETSTLTFTGLGSYKQIKIEAAVRPWNNGSGTDQFCIRFNNVSANEYNFTVNDNFSGNNSSVATNQIKLNNTSGGDYMTIDATIYLIGGKNSVTGTWTGGTNSGTTRRATMAGDWTPATPTAITSMLIRTPFGDPIGLGSNSVLKVLAK